MRFNDITTPEAEAYSTVFLVPEPKNPFDKNAIKVIGLGSDGKTRTVLGHVSRDSQPAAGVVQFNEAYKVGQTIVSRSGLAIEMNLTLTRIVEE
jgi:hypothetical protein